MKTIMLCAVLVSASAFGQDMRENLHRSLFSDHKANRVGETVTILVVESSSASNDARTSASRESNISFSASGKAGDSNVPDLSLGVGSGNSFAGEGSTVSRGTIRATLSARVDSVLENGNLVVSGSKTLIVNGEEQQILVSGIVRPSDIRADNSVFSYNISDARIAFEGSGIVSRAQGPGWITKLLHWLF